MSYEKLLSSQGKLHKVFQNCHTFYNVLTVTWEPGKLSNVLKTFQIVRNCVVSIRLRIESYKGDKYIKNLRESLKFRVLEGLKNTRKKKKSLKTKFKGKISNFIEKSLQKSFLGGLA